MQATQLDNIKSYIQLFNKAISDGDNSAAVRLGKKILQLIKVELERPELNQSIKSYYIESANKIKEFITDIQSVKTLGKKAIDENKSAKKKWFTEEIPKLSINDIIGLPQVKDEIIVNILAPMTEKYAKVYRKYKGNPKSKRILLYGPPGTGKTFTVKCIAGALGVPVAIVNSADILSSLVGEAEKNLVSVFEEAKQYDRCIIFFDEIDSLATSRDSDDARYTKGVLTTLLTLLDGFASNDEGKQHIVIAATNRPWSLDSAALRGGRFDSKIYIPLPDFEARVEFVKRAFGKDDSSKKPNIPFDSNVSVEYIAGLLEGFGGADIDAVCEKIIEIPLKAEIQSIRYHGETKNLCVTRKDCEQVINNYINPITDEMLIEFDAYSFNMSFEDYCKYLLKQAKNNSLDNLSAPNYVKRFIEKYL